MTTPQDVIAFRNLRPHPEPSYAMFVGPPPDEYRPLIRELLSYEILKPGDNPLRRTDMADLGGIGVLQQHLMPGSLHWSRQTEYPWSLVEAELEPSHEVLTISNGSSSFQFAAARRCRMVVDVWYDLKEMPSVQEEIRLVQAAWERFHNIVMVQGDVRELPWPDEWFDRVFCTSVLEHVPCDHFEGIAEMVRVLKPGGRLLLTMDIATEGAGAGENFFVTQEMIPNLLTPLGVMGILPNPSGPTIVTRTRDEGAVIFAVLIKYTKPKGDK